MRDILFPMEPKEFWQKLKLIVEQAVIEHNINVPLSNAVDRSIQRPLLKAKEVCAMFKISKPTLYEWMKLGKLTSIKIGSRRFFHWEDVEHLIESNRITRDTSQNG